MINFFLDQMKNVETLVIYFSEASQFSYVQKFNGKDGTHHEDEPQNSLDYAIFQNFQFLRFDMFSLSSFIQHPCLNLQLPSTLRAIYVGYFLNEPSVPSQHFDEEHHLTTILRTRKLPNLEFIGVPEKPFNKFDEPITSTNFIKTWKKHREKLKNLEMFKSGKV